jgi:hypothetical protein
MSEPEREGGEEPQTDEEGADDELAPIEPEQ